MGMDLYLGNLERLAENKRGRMCGNKKHVKGNRLP
jgi:hypothetical protein